jgi:predicted GIY-YIG superfamily endonuclease
LTPADYTIHVKNIPLNQNVDYVKQLTELFEQHSVEEAKIPSDNPIKVTKVVLVYDIEDLIEMENELKSMVEKKKKQLIKYE